MPENKHIRKTLTALALALPLSYLAMQYGYMAIHGSSVALFAIAPFFSMVDKGPGLTSMTTVAQYYCFQYLYYLVVVYIASAIAERIRREANRAD